MVYFRFYLIFVVVEESLYCYEFSSKNCSCCIPWILYGCIFIVICLKVFKMFFISAFTHSFLSSILFILLVIIFFSFLFLWLISCFMLLWSEIMLEIIYTFLSLLVLCHKCDQSYGVFHVHLNVYSGFFRM